jgi:hypothetical protein
MNIQEIDNDVDFLCGSTSASYPVADKRRNENIAYQDVARLIWQSAGGWQFDDSNATTLPVARTTLVHNQQDYTLPSTCQRVEEVVVKDSGGTWNKLKPFDIHDTTIAPEEYMGDSGMPIYYDLIGRSIMLYPTPSSAYCTMASGMGVYVNRDVTEFPVTAGTGYTPGFATPFHRILSYATAIDFTQDNSERNLLVQLKTRLEQGLINFYAKRDVENTPSIKPRSKKLWRQYI